MKKNKKKVITLNGSQVNAGIQARYIKDLNTLTRKMIYGYTQELSQLYMQGFNYNFVTEAQNKMKMLDSVFTSYFQTAGTRIATNMVQQTAFVQQANFARAFAKFMTALLKEAKPEDKVFQDFMANQFMPTNFIDTKEGKKSFLEAFTLENRIYDDIEEAIKQETINNNVELIKSIHQQYHREVSQALYDGIINGRTKTNLTELLQEAGVKTKRRARLIAMDQTNKIHSALHLKDLQKAGFTKAQWIHVGGGKTDRKSHVTPAPAGLNGAIFDIKKGAYDPQVNKFIKPAELPFCRCTAVAVWEI